MHVGKTFGPFELEKELGSGAMGTVYRATLRQEGKEDQSVALKVIAFGLSGNETALARFDREAKILKQLRHPNIVRLVGHGKYKNVPFFAMEYVAGRSMDRIMADRSAGIPGKAPFTWEEVVEFGKPLCGALQHAHDKGIIHRDLKPSNLMLTDEGVLKLTDFGIAKDVDVTALTGANNTIGTAAYMSPEQCKGEKHLTGKSDLYSLGVVFYEFLTGRKPFMAESSVDMFLLHVSGTFVRPSQLNPDIPVWLDTLVCQMMEKKPEHRPRDATMVGQVLEEIAEKMATKGSAGADIASVRGGASLDSSDRAVAQFIRAGAKKKKLRKRHKPIHTRGWFVALASILLVVGLGTTVYYLGFAAPSAATLIARIEGASDPDKKKAAVAEYLKYYAALGDEKTEQIKSLDRDFKVKARESVLLTRHRRDNLRGRGEEDDDPEAYRNTMLALSAENDGDLATARTTWSQLARDYSGETDSAKALWGWHAQKKINDLNASATAIDRLVRKIEDLRLDDKDVSFEDDVEQRASIAIRLEQLGDFSRAVERWSQLWDSLKGDNERRPMAIFAKSRVRELDAKKQVPKDSAERAKLLATRMQQASALMAMEEPARKRDGRNALRDVRDLYPGESGEVGTIVDSAKKALGG